MVVNVYGVVAVVIFYILILVIGLVAARKKKSPEENAETEEAMLAGRSIGMTVGVFTMTATWVGGGFINGTAEYVYLAYKGDGSGLVWVQAPVGYALSLAVGGLFFAKKMRNGGYVTMIDPFQRKYGNIMGGLLVIPALCGELFWSASILSALGTTLSVIIDLETWISVIISACIALLYTVFGGLYSVAYTDVVQLLCMLIGLVLSAPFALTNKNVESISETAYYPNGGWLGYLQGTSWGLYVDSALLLIFGGVPWQVYFQRVLSADSAKTAQILSLLGAVGCIIMSIPSVLIGAAGYSADWNNTAGYDGDIPPPSVKILPLVLQYLTPTAVSFVGLGAVSSCCHVIGRFIHASERELIWVMRISAIIFGIIAAVMGIFIDTIYGLWFLCSDLVYVILFPQLVAILYIPSVNIFGSASGYFVALLLRLLGGEPILKLPAVIKYPWYDQPSNIQYFPYKTFSMLIGFIVMLCVSHVTNMLMDKGLINVDLDKLTSSEERTVQNTKHGAMNAGAEFSMEDLRDS